MKRRIWIFCMIMLAFVLLSAPACKNAQDAAGKYERMEKRMMKEEEKKLESARKGHLKIQSKATRQMMKDAKKKAKKLNRPKKR